MTTAASHGSTVSRVALAASGTYRIDPDRTTVAFTTRHLFGMGRVNGILHLREGFVEIGDTESPVATIDVELDATSFATGNAQRDKDVRGARFLDADMFPRMRFTARLDPAASEHRGDLTVRDVTAPISLAVAEVAPTPAGFLVTARARVDRHAFGITRAKGLAARHLDVTVSATLEAA